MDEGFGSVRDLYEKEFDGISLWFQNEGTTEQTRNYKNYNSCTAPFPKYEFQIDLMDVSSLLRDVGVEIGEQPKFGMVCIDIFSKKLHVVPMKTNDTGTVFDAMMECFKVLGQPLMMYSDDEGALNSKKVQDFFKGEGITHIITKTHANQAERVIRSLKNMIADRLRANRDKTWVEMLQCARAGGRKIENTPIHRYTDPGGPRERSAQECGNTPIHRPRGTPRAIGAGLQQYTDTPTGGVRQYTDTPTQGGPASDRRRSAAIHRYTDPGRPRERSAQDCGNTPIHRPGECGNTPIHRPRGAPRAIGAGVRQYTDTPTQGDPASDRRRIAAIHRYTDRGGPRERSAQECGNTPIHRPRGTPRAIGAGLRQYTDTPTQGGPRERSAQDCGNTPIHRRKGTRERGITPIH